MFKNLMAKLGKGGARVDLLLERQDHLPGEEVRAELLIQGGSVEQKINRIEVDLSMRVQLKQRELRHTLERFPFPDSFTIRPQERKTLPFSSLLPPDLPVSGHRVGYVFVTRLDIAAGVDHSDHDCLTIHPPHQLQKVLAAFDELGLREKHDSRSFNGYAQEFQLFPTAFLQGRAEEVQFVAGIEEHGLRLLLEVDVFSWAGEREVRREILVENRLLEDHEGLTQFLKDTLSEMVQNPSAYTMPTHHGQHKHSGLSTWGGAVGGFAAGVLGAIALSELMEDAGEGISEAAGGDLFQEEEGGGLFEDGGDFFGGED